MTDAAEHETRSLHGWELCRFWMPETRRVSRTCNGPDPVRDEAEEYLVSLGSTKSTWDTVYLSSKRCTSCHSCLFFKSGAGDATGRQHGTVIPTAKDAQSFGESAMEGVSEKLQGVDGSFRLLQHQDQEAACGREAHLRQAISRATNARQPRLDTEVVQAWRI